ncbi:MAG: hypothetical protein MUE51_11775 [Thermoleophilia bacterium]|nr:hypothetical protein [Thermoleophilia bacterium]
MPTRPLLAALWVAALGPLAAGCALVLPASAPAPAPGDGWHGALTVSVSSPARPGTVRFTLRCGPEDDRGACRDLAVRRGLLAPFAPRPECVVAPPGAERARVRGQFGGRPVDLVFGPCDQDRWRPLRAVLRVPSAPEKAAEKAATGRV